MSVRDCAKSSNSIHSVMNSNQEIDFHELREDLLPNSRLQRTAMLFVGSALAPAVALHPFYGWRLLWHSAGQLRGCLAAAET